MPSRPVTHSRIQTSLVLLAALWIALASTMALADSAVVVPDPMRIELVEDPGADPAPRSGATAPLSKSLGLYDYTREFLDPGLPNLLQSACAFDAPNRRLVAWGGAGAYGHIVRMLSVDAPRTWTSVNALITHKARLGASAVIRPANQNWPDQTLYVFGGRDTSHVFAPYADGLVVTLAATPVAAGGIPAGPPARSEHVAIYRPADDAMYVFGGRGVIPGSPYFSDVWRLDLVTLSWTQIVPTGTAPTARYGACGIYDADSDRMIVHGGRGPALYDDTWALVFGPAPHWVPIASGGPLTLFSAHAYDALGDRMLLFGTATPSLYPESRTWSLSLGASPAWTELSATSGVPPAPRHLGTAFVDPVAKAFVAVGGADDSSFTSLSAFDAASLPLTGGGWSSLPIQRDRPVNLGTSTVLYDAPDQSFIVAASGQLTDGIWNIVALHPSAEFWRLRLTANGPIWTALPALPVTGTSAYLPVIYDAPSRRVVAYVRGTVAPAQVWQLTLAGTPTWSQLAVTGTPPPDRFWGAFAHDPTRRELLLFGGSQQSPLPALSDLWSLQLTNTTATWVQLAVSGSGPSPRALSAAAFNPDLDQLMVFGGSNNQADLWTFDRPSLTWNQHPTSGPSARSWARLVYDPSQGVMVMVSGRSTTMEPWLLVPGEAPVWQSLAQPGWTDADAHPYAGVGWDPVERRVLILGGARFPEGAPNRVIAFPSSLWALRSPACEAPGLACGGDAHREVPVGSNETIDFCNEHPFADEFRWFKDGVPISDDAHYSGTSTEDLTITDIQASHAGDYVLELVNDCDIRHSDPVTIVVTEMFGFGAPILSRADESMSEVAAADFSGDGLADAVTVGDSKIRVFKNTGAGELEIWAQLGPVNRPKGLIAGLLDSDAVADLMIAGNGSNLIHSFHGLGGATYSETTTPTLGRPARLALGRSILAASALKSPDRARVLAPPPYTLAVSSDQVGLAIHPVLHSPEGLTILPASYDLSPEARVQDVKMVDVTQDGFADLFAVGLDGIAVWYDRGTGDPPLRTLVDSFAGATTLTVADFTQDGWPDLVVNDPAGFALRFYMGTGDGSFGNGDVLSTGSIAAGAILSADFGADGTSDIVFASRTGTWIGVIERTATSWRPMRVYDALGDLLSLAVGDYNGDTRLDLLVGQGSNAELGVMLNVADPPAVGVPVPSDHTSPRAAVFAAPNPFRDATTLRFQLAREAQIAIEILDIGGRRVRSAQAGRHAPGAGEWHWDGRRDDGSIAPAGLYLARIRAAGELLTGRLVRMQ